MRVCTILLLLLACSSASGFHLAPHKASASLPIPRHYYKTRSKPTALSLMSANLPSQSIQLIATNLVSGYGIVSLWAIASSVVLPLTLYRQAYSFSVGYGFSIFFMALSLLWTFRSSTAAVATTPLLLTVTAMLYGARLGGYLVLRNTCSTAKSRGNQGL